MTCTNPRHAPDPGRDAALAVLARRYRVLPHVIREHTPPRTCLHCGGSEDFGAYAQCQPDGADLIGGCWSACGGTPWQHHVTWAQLDRFVAAPQMGLGI